LETRGLIHDNYEALYEHYINTFECDNCGVELVTGNMVLINAAWITAILRVSFVIFFVIRVMLKEEKTITQINKNNNIDNNNKE
jgi:hypothetical protein